MTIDLQRGRRKLPRLDDIPAHLRRDLGLPEADPQPGRIHIDLLLLTFLRLK